MSGVRALPGRQSGERCGFTSSMYESSLVTQSPQHHTKDSVSEKSLVSCIALPCLRDAAIVIAVFQFPLETIKLATRYFELYAG